MDKVDEGMHLVPWASFYSSQNRTMSVVRTCSAFTCDVSHVFRVIYLQVSMNEGLSYITSSVHITTTECVSTG